MIERGFRIEKDSMGKMKVPKDAYWGAQTQRAVENFPINGIRFPRIFISSLGIIKMASCQTNIKLGLLNKKLGRAIIKASKEVAEGRLDGHFVLDIFQTGSGTSTNMNANEVIANRANELLGKKLVHPNDHVNMGQSSNDVIPSCIHISAMELIEKELLPSLKQLHNTLNKKAKEFDRIVKIGRTHLQDATPVRLGQEFSGYASQLKHGFGRVENVRRNLSELALGGTAVGTGINTHPKFANLAIARINEITGLKFREAENHFEAQSAKDAVVETSSALKTLAVGLIKIANDIRLLGSGPHCGIGELILPSVQPGSSIMPGKVNPVIAESLLQVAIQVIGNDTAIMLGGIIGSSFELNVMMPVIAHNLLSSIMLLSKAVSVFDEKCAKGIKANKQRCSEMIEKSLAMCTALSPRIGYDAAASIAKEAYKTGKTVRQIAYEKNILPREEIDRLLNPWHMTEPS